MIKTGDDHAYYLLKLMSSPYETKCEVADDRKHSFPPFHRVVEGNYLEVFKEIHDGHLFYLDTKRKALISYYDRIDRILCGWKLSNTSYNNSEKAGEKCRNVYC